MINYYNIWLSNLNISNITKIRLMNLYEKAENIWNLSKDELFEIGIESKVVEKIIATKSRTNLESYINYMENKEIKLISFKDEYYPSYLNEIYNKPAFLYIRGNMNNLYDDCVAIVGSRDASYYGCHVARKFAKELADKNINIISGLAIGIDKFAHLGALDSKIGKTIAVLGTGVSDNEVYPLQNRKIFERILENDGTIISEFKLGTKPERYNFPLRNRIISGLAKKVIVVEAKENSGSLITANFALEQGKDVYAVPRKYYIY